MDINEKMKICFNDELLENKILTENEKKVLASLMYSYQICSKSHDNEIIRSMDAIMKDTRMNKNALYDAVRNLESLYHMIERKAGKSRALGQPSIGSTFKLNFDTIFHPPKEHVKFDFSKIKKPSETPINTVDIDIVTGVDVDSDTIVDTSKEIDEVLNTIIDKDIITNKEVDNEVITSIDNVSDEDVVFENEVNIDSNEGFNYDIYKDRSTWYKSLPDEQNQSEYEKERIIFELYQLHDYNSIIDKIDKIEKLFIRGCSDKYRERILHILNEKSNEIGYKFSIYLN